MTLLETSHVQKVYRQGGFFSRGKQVEVLTDVSLYLDRGECLGLVGRSGCGKSTLGRLFLGLERPDAGVVRYKGHDIATLRGADWWTYRRNVQVVFQDFVGAVNPRMRVGDIIAEPLRNFGQSRSSALRQQVPELLEMVGLRASDAGKLPAHCSGGQLQRVCIARAMALNPEIVVLDESVSSLDMLVQAQVMELLAKLGREHGMSILFISHDLRVVSRLSNRVAVLQHGHIVECAPCVDGRADLTSEGFRELANSLLPAKPQGMEASCYDSMSSQVRSNAVEVGY
ncbi:ATP-binding cassette domain-containing protein [Desulfovibrio inopinatus]|uniref:ATP-binding cassette domain-containing protein n=1 Tax=Desulfovibrio inopinatus TaxID=102109 RepID=UPI00040714AE|nr:ABC transporter ATP-binding protein [Desulfovibrio inopinatus]